jgi:Mg-chelatase subunit ChlD
MDSQIKPFRNKLAMAGTVAGCLLGFACLCSAPFHAQQTTRLTAGPSYTSNDGNGGPKFPRVEMVFSLTGADGLPIRPNPADLRLLSQGKELSAASSIRPFSETGYGITALLAIDASGSMRGAPLKAIHASIAKFVGRARPVDKIAVITFADDTRMDVPFDHTNAELARELETVNARGTTTRLWDGLLFALDQFDTVSPKRRQLTVISDGHDEGSTHHLEDVIRKAKAFGVVVDAIGLTRDPGKYLHFLQELAGATGGNYARALSAPQLDQLMDGGINAMQTTPVAVFDASKLTPDGTAQTVSLQWQPGHLSAGAFVTPPRTATGAKIARKSDKPVSRVESYWIYGLAACFVAGIILLFISWRSARQKPQPAGSQALQPPPPPPAPVYVPTHHDDGALSSPGKLDPFRKQTIDENVPEIPAPPAPDPYVLLNPRNETVEENLPPRNRGRAMTQLVSVFDAPPEGPFARIVVKTGELAGDNFFVTSPSFTLGAVDGNSLVLKGDPTISGKHARLLWEEGILKVEDTNSTNGTYLNSQRLQPGRHLVKPGDEIRVGQVVLVLTRA